MLLFGLLISLIGSLETYRRLKRERRYRDIIVSAFFLSVGLVLGMLQMLHVKLPFLMDGLIAAFQPFSKLLETWLS